MVEMKKWTFGNQRDPATKVGALVNEIYVGKTRVYNHGYNHGYNHLVFLYLIDKRF